MKESVLARRLGNRLSPLTKVTNRHLFPVYNQPMIYYLLETLEPSTSGELKITDFSNTYIRQAEVSGSTLDGWCTDAGTFDSLLRANKLLAEREYRKTMHS